MSQQRSANVDATSHQNIIDQVAQRLTAFCRFHTSDPHAVVSDVIALPGHAGLSFKFLLEYRCGDELKRESLMIRLAPAGVRPSGTADVARQGRIMASLRGSEIPVPAIRWVGDDDRWFAAPYYVAELVTAPNSRRGDEALDALNAIAASRAAVSVMARLHALDFSPLKPTWGEPVTISAELARWESLLARPNLEPALAGAAATLGRHLRAGAVDAGPVGCVHGDFQWTNLLFSGGEVLAVLDWELAMIGPTLLDLTWLCLFCDAASWETDMLVPSAAPSPEGVVALYEEATKKRVRVHTINWFRALAAYRFGVIAIFNLMLHRRGKRIDPAWETIARSVPRMFERALELCP